MEQGISPVAVKSVAAIRLMKEFVAKDAESEKQVAWLLESLFGNIARNFGDGTLGEKMMKELPEREGIALGTSLCVLSTYFEHQGNWQKMLAGVEQLFSEIPPHQGIPPQVLERLVQHCQKRMKADLAEAYARRNDPRPLPKAAPLPQMQASDL